MSTLFAEHTSDLSQITHASNWMKQIRRPLEAWSARRRHMVAILIAVLVFGVGTNAWITADLAGLQASRVALSEAQQRVVLAKQSVAQLPEQRRSAAMSSSGKLPEPSTPADDVRLISLLAARSGVTLLTLAPAAGNGAGLDEVRPIQLTAQTDFLHLMMFMRGLSDLPVLVVPEDLTVKRSAQALLVSATLHVFNALSPVPISPETVVDDDMDADDEEVVFNDPFTFPSQADGDVPQAGLLRLAGLLRDRIRGLALLETTDGAATVEQGQLVGGDRVTGMDALSITLTNRIGTRTLALTEAS
jgi:Tfp pilus assembly protein PilO